MRFKTEPYAHQLECFDATRERTSYGIFWEMGCGKSKITLDTAAWQYLNGYIDTLLVVAPKGVHRNWITDEVPRHLSEDVEDVASLWYQSTKAGQKRYQQQLDTAIEFNGLLIVAINYDALITKAGKAFCDRLMQRKVMVVLDESPRIKNPTAKRTKAALKLGDQAVSRRILTGTPITNGPFDAYSQVAFLEPNFWKARHFGSFLAFKNYFGIFNTQSLADGRRFNMCVGYRNVDNLYDMLQSISDRKTKDTVLDLPDKIYSKVYVELTTPQRRLYDEIRDHAIAFLSNGDMITANLIIVEMLRLQQIINGFVVTEQTQEPVDIEGGNPRLDALVEVLNDNDPQQAIVWARFQHDIDLIAARLGEEGISYATYDGRTSDVGRAEAIDRFRSGDARIFVANPAAAGEGLTLTEATVVVYYSNTFKLAERLQSEDRAHRIGQKKSVLYVDLVCPDTIDERIVTALRKKLEIANVITGDNLKEWI
jgi:SNF2 family DNA or RNA helicase